MTTVQGIIGYDRILPVEKVAGTIARYRNAFDRRSTTVRDVRSHRHDFTLDVHGFQFVDDESQVRGWSDVDRVKATVYRETETLLLKICGASRVRCYSHLVRRNPLSAIEKLCEDKNVTDNTLTSLSVPSPAAHIDHSEKGSLEILEDNFPEAAAIRETGKRWAIVNVWRPLKTVHRDPLCLVDARTVEPQDLVPQRIHLPKDASSTFKDVSRGKSFESIGVRPNPGHEWYFCSEMTPSEALLFKIYDSAAGGQRSSFIAGGVPHTSLQIPGTEEMEARESIELRCLVFWD